MISFYCLVEDGEVVAESELRGVRNCRSQRDDGFLLSPSTREHTTKAHEPPKHLLARRLVV